MSDCLGHHDQPHPADIGYLCHNHHQRLRSLLVELPAVATWLHVNIAAHGSGSNDEAPVTGSREDPIPLRVDILDLIGPDSPRRTRGDDTDQTGADALRAVLAHYATLTQTAGHPYPALHTVTFDDATIGEYPDRHTADETLRRLQHTDRRRLNPRRWRTTLAPARAGWAERAPISHVVTYLTGHLSWLAEQDWVADMLDELRQAHIDAHRIAPWREEVLRDRDPCGVCGRATVVVHVAAGESRCERKAGGCGRTQPLSEYVLTALLPGTRRAS